MHHAAVASRIAPQVIRIGADQDAADGLDTGIKKYFSHQIIYDFFIHFVHTICFAVWVIYHLVMEWFLAFRREMVA